MTSPINFIKSKWFQLNEYYTAYATQFVIVVTVLLFLIELQAELQMSCLVSVWLVRFSMCMEMCVVDFCCCFVFSLFTLWLNLIHSFQLRYIETTSRKMYVDENYWICLFLFVSLLFYFYIFSLFVLSLNWAFRSFFYMDKPTSQQFKLTTK